MNEVYNRIDELQEQLTTAFNTDKDLLESIASNIENETISTTLTKYAEANLESCSSTTAALDELKAYLSTKISDYSAEDTQAQSDLASVQSILDQL